MYDNEFETKGNKIATRGKGFILSLPSPRDSFTLSTNREPVHRVEIATAIDWTSDWSHNWKNCRSRFPVAQPFIQMKKNYCCHSWSVFRSVFPACTVTRWKIKMQTIQYRRTRIWEMKKDKSTKTLAKNQVCEIFQMRDIGKNGLPKFIKLCMNGLETKISRTFVDFLHLGHEFFFISGHGT